MSPFQAIADDVQALLQRALLGKMVVAFGEDGLGKYGRRDQALSLRIADVSTVVWFDEQTNLADGIVHLLLADYDADVHGHICTDRNFLISIGDLLDAQAIDRSTIWYSPIDMQSRHHVALQIDIPNLLQWP